LPRRGSRVQVPFPAHSFIPSSRNTMEYTLTKNDNAIAHINFTFNADEIEDAFKQVYKETQKTAKIAGFRQGKAPMDVVIRLYGDSVSNKVVDQLVRDSFAKIFSDLDPKPYAYPKFQLEKFDRKESLVVSGVYETLPRTELGDYRSLSVDTYDIMIPESQIEEQLKYIQNKKAILQLKEDKELSTEVDMVEAQVITYEADGSKSIYDPKNIIQYFIGRKENPQGMDAHFIGLHNGQEFTFTYEYPSDHPDPSYSGKTEQYDVLVKGVYKVTYPEINDEFAQEFNGSATLSDMKFFLTKDLQNYYLEEVRKEQIRVLLDQLVQISKFEIPDSLLVAEAHSSFKQFLQKNGREVVPMEEYAERIGRTYSDLLSELKVSVKSQLMPTFAITKLIEQENLAVSLEDAEKAYDAYIQRQMAEGNQTDLPSPEQQQEAIKRVKIELEFQKAYQFLYDAAKKPEPVSISLEELLKKLYNPR
jgi:trigger factor